MAVNNVIRILNLTRGLNTDGDVDADSLADNFVSNNFFQDNKSSGPTITSIHPSANVSPGDTIYIDGTGFDRSANVMLISNSNIDIVVPKGSITFNNSANLIFSVPDGVRFFDEDYDVRLTIDNTGLAAVQLDALDILNITGFQGAYSGYTSGGLTPPSQDTIDKFPFSSDANATDVGDLTVSRYGLAGQSSKVSGYTSGGNPVPTTGNIIDKFPFAADGNATDVGDLTFGRYILAGQSSSESGYNSGGLGGPVNNIIDKFPFSSDANATDVGDLTVARYYLAGQSSDASGYSSGGVPPTTNTIDKFPFASDGNATDVGDLTVARQEVAGQSSDASGYTTGGNVSSTVIDKFPFSSDANATDVGDLTGSGKRSHAGQSSTVSGYSSGGDPGPTNVIDKFPFSSDANATDVGDLTVARYFVAGQQI